jgi:YjbE family integral membrane protein
VPLFDFVDLGSMSALLSVVIIDVVLAGDNAIVVGMAAAGLPRERRRWVILIGIGAATVLRIGLASVAVSLLAIIGLTLAGGVLLLWVAWKLFRELRQHQRGMACGAALHGPPVKSFAQAVWQVVLADVSMSLDNVLAVAGTARDHFWVLAVGLLLSVALMGLASNLVARLLARYRWIAWIGLAIVTAVALRMIYDGSTEVMQHTLNVDSMSG